MADDVNNFDKDRPANDNRPPDAQENGEKAAVSGRLDTAVMSIARLIGRRMAREDFAARIAANDNRGRRTADDE